MRSKAFLVALLTSLFGLTGCLQPDEGSGFSWPEKKDSNCKLVSSMNASCIIYMEDFKTPIVSLVNKIENALWIADLNGEIRSWDGTNEYLLGNLSSKVSACHPEQGLLGMALSDNYENDKKLLLSYVEYQNCGGQSASPLVLADVSVENGSLNISTLRVLHEIVQPYRNHNAGHLLSAGNGYYLWGVGDGGGSNDPDNNGQNESSPLSSIHYFKYDGTSISPVMFNSDGSSTYILHKGLRNPWKFDIDENGGLWIADVGQNCFEEVNYIQSWNTSSNFGWSLREGSHSFSPNSDCSLSSSASPKGITDPVIEYDHVEGNCSITGGFWMNDSFPVGEGYLYGDFCTGSVWIVQNKNNWTANFLFDTDLQIVGFGKGLNGELLIFHWSGSVFEIVFEEVNRE